MKIIKSLAFIVTLPITLPIAAVKVYRQKKALDKALELRKTLSFNSHGERIAHDQALNQQYKAWYGKDLFTKEQLTLPSI